MYYKHPEANNILYHAKDAELHMLFKQMNVFLKSKTPKEGWEEVGFWDAGFGYGWAPEGDFFSDKIDLKSYSQGFSQGLSIFGAVA